MKQEAAAKKAKAEKLAKAEGAEKARLEKELAKDAAKARQAARCAERALKQSVQQSAPAAFLEKVGNAVLLGRWASLGSQFSMRRRARAAGRQAARRASSARTAS